MTIKQKRTVYINDINKIKTFGHQWKLYGYSLQDISLLLNLSVETLRNMISKKLLDPSSLDSICRLYLSR